MNASHFMKLNKWLKRVLLPNDNYLQSELDVLSDDEYIRPLDNIEGKRFAPTV